MNYNAKLFCVAMVFALCAPSMLLAVDTFFTANSGDWDDPANWSTGAVPGMDDNSFIGDFGFATPAVVNICSTPSSPIVGDIRLGVGPLGDATLNHSGGDLTTAQFKWNFIGADGVNGASAVGTYNLSGAATFTSDIGVPGVIDADPEFHLGIGSDGSGAPGENVGNLSVSDTASFTANRMYVGSNDGNFGNITQTGGSVYVDDWLSIGREFGATGTYNLSGGSLTVANDGITVGESTGASGEMNLSNDATINTGQLQVGRSLNSTPEDGGGTGLLTLTGDQVDVTTGFLSMGYTVDFFEPGQIFIGTETDGEATLRFTSASSVSPITVLEDVYLNDGTTAGFAQLEVDLETNPPSAGNLLLIDVGGTLTGQFMGLPEGTLVPNSGGRTITYVGGDGNDIFLLGMSTVDGDFDNNGLWNCADIDALTAAIAASSTDLSFDMNNDGVINLDDVTDAGVGWLAVGGANNPGQTSGGNPFLEGDANLDGTVDGGDFLTWNGTKFTANDAWCSGDFDGSGFVDGGDFLIWNTFKFQSSDSVASVPEPTGLALVVSLLGLLAVRRR